jgi:cysteinyl-tRNA synthetase
METLIEKGHAYAAPDGSGDVYFDVRSWPDYGSLSHQSLDDMASADDADPRGKRDPRDFALWKGRKAEEPESASWPTPFGAGRPGWHLECSAMARRYLGDEFDIHGGGIDLRFPHHENEQAQSRAAGLGFARYWLHNAWVTVKGQKMGKSLGNSLEVRELLKTTRPIVLRYYLTAAHYRSTVEYHPGSLEEAAAAVERIEGFLERVSHRREVPPASSYAAHDLPEEFRAALDDDLGVPGALAVIHETVRAGNTALDEADDDAALAAASAVVAMAEVLGVNPLAEHWSRSADRTTSHVAEEALEALVGQALEARQSARQERDFARADAIRDELAAVGISIEDTPSGARWSLSRSAASVDAVPAVRAAGAGEG